MAVAAFWLALAAVLIANRWRARHIEAERHETIRLIIEKEPHVDLAKIKELLYPTPAPCVLPPNHPWMKKDDPEARYRLMRMWGAILMIGAVGIGALIVGGGLAQGLSSAIPFGVGATVFCFLAGVGLFHSARFMLRRAKADEQAREP
jgi:hypothetical protein